MKALNNSRSIHTLAISFESSQHVDAPDLMASPKSNNNEPGITVSRSITARPFFVSLSKSKLFNFVSLWVTLHGIVPSLKAFIITSIPLACFFIKSISCVQSFALPFGSNETVANKCSYLFGVL